MAIEDHKPLSRRYRPCVANTRGKKRKAEDEVEAVKPPKSRKGKKAVFPSSHPTKSTIFSREQSQRTTSQNDKDTAQVVKVINNTVHLVVARLETHLLFQPMNDNIKDAAGRLKVEEKENWEVNHSAPVKKVVTTQDSIFSRSKRKLFPATMSMAWLTAIGWRCGKWYTEKIEVKALATLTQITSHFSPFQISLKSHH